MKFIVLAINAILRAANLYIEFSEWLIILEVQKMNINSETLMDSIPNLEYRLGMHGGLVIGKITNAVVPLI